MSIFSHRFTRMNTDQIRVAETLVIADYPIGYASGFGETLYNLFTGFPREKLWTAHPGHNVAPLMKSDARNR